MFAQQIEQGSTRIELQAVIPAVYFELNVNHLRGTVWRRAARGRRGGQSDPVRTKCHCDAGSGNFFQELPARFQVAAEEQLIEWIALGESRRQRIEFLGLRIFFEPRAASGSFVAKGCVSLKK